MSDYEFEVDHESGMLHLDMDVTLSFDDFRQFMKDVMTHIATAELKRFIMDYPDFFKNSEEGTIYVYWKRLEEHDPAYLDMILDGKCPLCHEHIEYDGDFWHCDGCNLNVLWDEPVREEA